MNRFFYTTLQYPPYMHSRAKQAIAFRRIFSLHNPTNDSINPNSFVNLHVKDISSTPHSVLITTRESHHGTINSKQ